MYMSIGNEMRWKKCKTAILAGEIVVQELHATK